MAIKHDMCTFFCWEGERHLTKFIAASSLKLLILTGIQCGCNSRCRISTVQKTISGPIWNAVFFSCYCIFFCEIKL